MRLLPPLNLGDKFWFKYVTHTVELECDFLKADTPRHGVTSRSFDWSKPLNLPLTQMQTHLWVWSPSCVWWGLFYVCGVSSASEISRFETSQDFLEKVLGSFETHTPLVCKEQHLMATRWLCLSGRGRAWGAEWPEGDEKANSLLRKIHLSGVL